MKPTTPLSLGPYTEQCIEFLYLSNPTESSIAYKVKTTAPLRYHVKPAIGIIAPKGEATVTIVFDLLGKDKPPNFQQSKHKFLLEAALVSTLMDTDVTKIVLFFTLPLVLAIGKLAN